MSYSRLLKYTSPMMHGDDVKQVQSKLIFLAYSCGSYGADGWFGSSTKSAVIDFQQTNHLSVDGIVGPNTWNKLFSGSAIANSMRIASASGLRYRAKRLPGEGTYYDPDTGVYFNPRNGVIENLSTKYTRQPGEALFIKTGTDKMYFYSNIYKQFIPGHYSTSANIHTESTDGFTFYLGVDGDLGLGIGCGVSFAIALSYNKNTNKWTISGVSSASGTTVVGVDCDAGLVFGYVSGNENALKGYSKTMSGNIPIGDISVASDGKTHTIQFKLGVGILGSYSYGYTVTKSIKLFTQRNFF